MNLTEISPNTVQDMLIYIYTNTVEDLDKKARDLLPVAEKYDLSGLKNQCSIALIQQIKLETAGELVLMADLYNVDNLEQAAARFIVDHKKHYQEDGSWQEMIKNNPDLLMDMFLNF